MSPLRRTLPRSALALLAAASLAGCQRGEAAGTPRAQPLVASDVDPAVTSAINDPILTDRTLSSQSNRNAIRSVAGPAEAFYPPNADKLPAPACAGATLVEGAAWAGRLPPEFALYPGARIVEAAGTDAASCRLRAVELVSADPWDRVLGWYQARAAGASYAVARRVRDGDQILSGRRGDQAFYLIASPRGGGSEVSLIVGG
jgi:hypothetical protein